MTLNKTVSLIEGTFTPEEAQEIIVNLFGNKIQFHELKDFSTQERFGKDDAVAQKRLPELRNSQKQCLEQIAEAVKLNKSLKISSNIQIEWAD